MSDYDLIRRDNEYQKEIRRRKMTDAAKIGLLVAQNVQQFQTNQILAQVHSEACRTNQFLGHMASTLDQIAHMQATHFEQVQRERSLKEVMFQFEKFLDETEAYGDPVAAAFGMKRLFEVLDHPGNGFSTVDLSDLGDKRHFDGLTTRAKGLLTGLPRQQFEEMEQFEQLLGVYHERRAIGFNAEKAFPKKHHVKLPKEFREQPPTPPPPKKTALENKANEADSTALFQVGCGGCLSVIGLLGLAIVLSMIVAGDGQGVGGSALFYGMLCLGGGVLLLKYFRGRNDRRDLLREAEQSREDSVRQQEQNNRRKLEEWNNKKQLEESKIAKANQQIDAENAEIEEKRRQATKLFQATMEEMRSLINGFLNQHPPIQKFVARV